MIQIYLHSTLAAPGPAIDALSEDLSASVAGIFIALPDGYLRRHELNFSHFSQLHAIDNGYLYRMI